MSNLANRTLGPRQHDAAADRSLSIELWARELNQIVGDQYGAPVIPEQLERARLITAAIARDAATLLDLLNRPSKVVEAPQEVSP
jgi:hypothetical protein